MLSIPTHKELKTSKLQLTSSFSVTNYNYYRCPDYKGFYRKHMVCTTVYGTSLYHFNKYLEGSGKSPPPVGSWYNALSNNRLGKEPMYNPLYSPNHYLTLDSNQALTPTQMVQPLAPGIAPDPAAAASLEVTQCHCLLQSWIQCHCSFPCQHLYRQKYFHREKYS